MNTRAEKLRMPILSALFTAFSLVGGLLLGIFVGSFTFEQLPGHMTEVSRGSIAAVPALLGMFAGGALWGFLMAKLAQMNRARRMALAGALVFGLTVVLVAILLGLLEVQIVQRGNGPQLPVHQLFTLLFVPAAFIIAAVGAFVMGLALKDRQAGFQLAFRAGLAAAITFLVVNLLMDALGWRIGAPRAAERFTMLTVMFVSNSGAALAAGAVIGVWINQHLGIQST